MSHYFPFTALGAVSWEKDLSSGDPSSLEELVTSTLASAELLIESLPTPSLLASPVSAAGAGKGGGRARSHTDSAVFPPTQSHATAAKARDEKDAEVIKKLQKEWKDLKIPQGGSNNPHNISMYKLSAKDGKYAWFARRSLHRSAGTFELWEAALRREMEETLARVEREPGREPGTGNIRGIGGERRVWRWQGEAGQLDLYHVSARFPGPTTPRDFVTLLMMPREEKGDRSKGDEWKDRPPRQFMIVSRPCDHPDCPPRSGFIRGTYESVELIREVPVEKLIRRARSSIDLSRDEIKDSAKGGGFESEAESRARLNKDGDGADTEMAIEWLMVTRSDPGGSVPKFMVEKGTPGGIINDAGKFLKWLSSQTLEDLTKPRRPQEDSVETKPTAELPTEEKQPGQAPFTASVQDQLPNGKTVDHQEEALPAGTGGIYGMLTGALGAATSAVANRVAAFASSSQATDSDLSDVTSEASFASAEEGNNTSAPDAPLPNNNAQDTSNVETDAASTISEATTSQALSREPTPSAGFSQAQSRHEKELRKLQSRMRKAEEKLERRRTKHSKTTTSKTETAADNDTASAKEKKEAEEDQALAKLREKHEREIARQEEKYRRELERLAQKRAAEERKAEQRRRKQAEREERANLAMELDRVKAERDVARKEVEMLRERVGELQGQNTRLVARLGREGIKVDDVAESGGSNSKEKGEGGKGGK